MANNTIVTNLESVKIRKGESGGTNVEVSEADSSAKVLAVNPQIEIKNFDTPKVEIKETNAVFQIIEADDQLAVEEIEMETIKLLYAGAPGGRGQRGEQGERGPIGIGERGPKGDQGNQGDQGPIGIGERGLQGERGERGMIGKLTSFVYNAPTASKEWIITHNLECYPKVSVVDSAGTLFTADISYIDINTLKVSFAYAMGGTAYLG